MIISHSNSFLTSTSTELMLLIKTLRLSNPQRLSESSKIINYGHDTASELSVVSVIVISRDSSHQLQKARGQAFYLHHSMGTSTIAKGTLHFSILQMRKLGWKVTCKPLIRSGLNPGRLIPEPVPLSTSPFRLEVPSHCPLQLCARSPLNLCYVWFACMWNWLGPSALI